MDLSTEGAGLEAAELLFRSGMFDSNPRCSASGIFGLEDWFLLLSGPLLLFPLELAWVQMLRLCWCSCCFFGTARWRDVRLHVRVVTGDPAMLQ